MKTISTKLDKEDHELFIELCNSEGLTPSESLRSLIQDYCNSAIIIEDEDNEPQIKEDQEQKPLKVVSLEPNKPRIFDCVDGYLYENGKNLGKCSDYILRGGMVYDKNNNFLGKTIGLIRTENTKTLN
jgi:hypothetical protein